MAEMFNPPHPGLTLRDDVLPAFGLTEAQAAQQLGVRLDEFSPVIHGEAPISAELALRIERWLVAYGGGRAGLWLAGQNDYDLWQARQRLRDSLNQIQPAPPVLEEYK